MLSGTEVIDHGDHLIVRTASQPTYHWGNFVQVTTGDGGDADHWLEVFSRHFPRATHRAVGLAHRPDPDAWSRRGLTVEVDQSLVADAAPSLTPLSSGYTVRRLVTDHDWAARFTHELDENDRTGEQPPDEYRRFMKEHIRVRRELVGRGRAAWFGAFERGALAASLGIVTLGDDARYQSVLTHADHRRRGLARHLLTHAAQWALTRGARRLVIVAESGSAAARIYERAGFVPGAEGYGAYAAR